MDRTDSTIRRVQENHRPTVNPTSLFVQCITLPRIPQENQNQMAGRSVNTYSDVIPDIIVNPRLQQTPTLSRNLETTANRIPHPRSWCPREQADRTLSEALSRIDARSQENTAHQTDNISLETTPAAATAFKINGYNHMIAGPDLHFPRTKGPINGECACGLETMVKDEDFRAFVLEARFLEGREGREPDRRNPLAVIKYADQPKK